MQPRNVEKQSIRILALVLAGGAGTRLHPLTAEHAKPALPFARGYRVIDFVLSNLVNSQIAPIYVVVQYKPRSLIEHIRGAWAPWSRGEGCEITVVRPENSGNNGAFKGTADAVYQNLHLVERHQPDLVGVFAADHIYRMDVRQMVRFHVEHLADVSIAAVRIPIEQASSFGIMAEGPGNELLDFQEKPERPASIPSDPGQAYASMGIYLFSSRVLVELVTQAIRRGDTDFGHHIMPRLTGGPRTLVYDFVQNIVPKVKCYEERGYWRDIGTLDVYKAAQQDVLGPLPRFNLVNPAWPIRGGNYRKPRGQPRRSSDGAVAAVSVPMSAGAGASGGNSA